MVEGLMSSNSSLYSQGKPDIGTRIYFLLFLPGQFPQLTLLSKGCIYVVLPWTYSKQPFPVPVGITMQIVLASCLCYFPVTDFTKCSQIVSVKPHNIFTWHFWEYNFILYTFWSITLVSLVTLRCPQDYPFCIFFCFLLPLSYFFLFIFHFWAPPHFLNTAPRHVEAYSSSFEPVPLCSCFSNNFQFWLL